MVGRPASTLCVYQVKDYPLRLAIVALDPVHRIGGCEAIQPDPAFSGGRGGEGESEHNILLEPRIVDDRTVRLQCRVYAAELIRQGNHRNISAIVLLWLVKRSLQPGTAFNKEVVHEQLRDAGLDLNRRTV